MSDWKDIVSGLTKGPGPTETDSKVVEAGIAGLLLLAGYGLMKFLSNSKAEISEVNINGVKKSDPKKK
ncbi:hypothetical protein [Diaphorobacter nitroreducens]|uniref:hypothetical protein n=1 Tax=Diaphorobacter nitroreducens TaxID=164759 RepID=UPI0028AFB90F|nr:hypothetical protein [Diaphorobacter nitroreducens]